jgi:putative colanic acid biosynthesis acetyltransferase WcaF
MSLLDASATRPLEGGASFSLGNRLLRMVWGLAWTVLARWTPPPLFGWRRLVLLAFGAKMGKGARVYGSTRIWLPANLTLGDRALIGPGVTLYNQGHITIGAYAVISQGAHICASSHDIRSPYFQLVLRPITIGEYCWVAAEAFVGPGVVMGDRSVLAARGALFGPAEADGVYRGNPAQFLKPRGLTRES